MFVSRKCLAAFIHLFPRELSTRIHVAQLIHQRPEFLRSALPACEPLQPIAEELMQCSVLTLRFLSGKLNVGLVGVKGNVLSHENSVHEFSVLRELVQPRLATRPIRAHAKHYATLSTDRTSRGR